jgi:CheY-like chemotaxis protein
MPDGNGIELHDKLRQLSTLPPCALISASSSIRNQQCFEQHNFDLLIEKPIVSTQFISLVQQLLQQKTDEADTQGTKNKLQGLRILLAEDNRINQMVMRELLNNFGCSFDIASDGAEALQLFKDKHLANPNYYHVVLMDCEMPIMDGFMTTSSIRELEQQQQRSHITIYALTAHALPEHSARCYAASMSRVISKPVDEDLLYNLLLQHWQKIAPATAK